jgi:hypothetical protein
MHAVNRAIRQARTRVHACRMPSIESQSNDGAVGVPAAARIEE